MKCYKLIIRGITKIYLYRLYIPELIRLANDVQITQVQELLIQLKLLPHHTVKVMLKYLVRQMQAHNVSFSCLNFRNPITSSADLVQIINIGNNMYSALSQSCKQGLLILTDLPVMVIT